MRLRDIIGLILALILAVGVAFLTRIFLTKEEYPKQVTPSVRKSTELTKILVAKKDLLEGNIIKPGDLAWQDWPLQAFQPTYTKEGTVRIEAFTGSVVRHRLNQGEPILPLDLVKPGDKGILAALVSRGKVAVSIDVTPQSASSGLLGSGDYVDVILSKAIASAAESGPHGQSKTIISNVKVLAMDVEMTSAHEKPKNPPHVATLEVTPAQAEHILAAVKEGTLSLILHSLDMSKEASPPPPENEAEAPPSKEKKVILMRGKEKSEIQVQEQ